MPSTKYQNEENESVFVPSGKEKSLKAILLFPNELLAPYIYDNRHIRHGLGVQPKARREDKSLRGQPREGRAGKQQQWQDRFHAGIVPK